MTVSAPLVKDVSAAAPDDDGAVPVAGDDTLLVGGETRLSGRVRVVPDLCCTVGVDELGLTVLEAEQ